MALRIVSQHPKFFRLMKLLDLPAYAALGLLESLWHFCARFSPNGAVGKFSDDEIAAGIGWDREPDALVRALVESRWLDEDEDPEFRLIVHDWSTYADEIVHCELARVQPFCDGTAPKSGRLNGDEREIQRMACR